MRPPAEGLALPMEGAGCVYRARCDRAMEACASAQPEVSAVPGTGNHWVECLLTDHGEDVQNDPND